MVIKVSKDVLKCGCLPVAVYFRTLLVLVLPSGNEMKYCRACLKAHVEQLETHQDVLNDKATRNWAVSKSGIKTCGRCELTSFLPARGV